MKSIMICNRLLFTWTVDWTPLQLTLSLTRVYKSLETQYPEGTLDVSAIKQSRKDSNHNQLTVLNDLYKQLPSPRLLSISLHFSRLFLCYIFSLNLDIRLPLFSLCRPLPLTSLHSFYSSFFFFFSLSKCPPPPSFILNSLLPPPSHFLYSKTLSETQQHP